MEMQQIFELEKSLLNLQVYLRLKKVNFPPELVPTYLQLLELPDIILKQIVILPRVEKYEIQGTIYLAKNVLLNGATFVGQWKKNWKNGRGQEYNEKKYQMGYWKDGEFVYGHIISEDWALNGVASNFIPLDGKIEELFCMYSQNRIPIQFQEFQIFFSITIEDNNLNLDFLDQSLQISNYLRFFIFIIFYLNKSNINNFSNFNFKFF